MREMRIKHTRDVHKLQQELKEAIALIKERETCHENAMARQAQRLETDLKELIAAATSAAKSSCTKMKEEHKKHLREVEDKHKREMSELQEKLANVTLERDKARAAISDMVKLGTESVASFSRPTDNQATDSDSLSSEEAVVDKSLLDELRQDAFSEETLKFLTSIGSSDEFISDFKAFHQRERKRLEDKRASEAH